MTTRNRQLSRVEEIRRGRFLFEILGPRKSERYTDGGAIGRDRQSKRCRGRAQRAARRRQRSAR